jgi:LPS export ABC transporter protein LptC
VPSAEKKTSHRGPAGLLLLLPFILAGCRQEKNEIPIRHYAGPMVSSESLHTTYLDSGQVKLEMDAPVQSEFANGNQEFPRGITVHFYNASGQLQSSLKAGFVHYNKNQDLYTAIGKVVLEDLIRHEKLETEKLHWSRTEGRVFNNEFVRITTPSQILTGKGLTARQDFSSYTILEPEGRILHADSLDFF